jgi:transposase
MPSDECFAGCDVSKDHIDITIQLGSNRRKSKQFANTPDGHRRMVQWMTEKGHPVRVVVEATGMYSLDLTLALHESEFVELMVANPRATKRFAEAQMQRSKTDRIDADSLCTFAERMPFQQWRPPRPELLELRSLARRIEALTQQHLQERGRLHAARMSRTTPAVVLNDIEGNLRHLDRRIGEMLRQARRLIKRHAMLDEAFTLLTSIRGIAEKSAVFLLPELAMLPDDMTVRQWVAHAGLDPCKHQSGSSVERHERISKVGNARIRRALYMPALVAIRCEPNVRAFYEKLVARGKRPIVAVVAVMRKLLHSIYGMFKHREPFDGDKFYRPAMLQP